MNTAEMIANRRVTRKISTALEQRLALYLSCISGCFSPVNLLGKYINGQHKANVANDDLAFSTLQDHYAKVTTESPFALKKELTAPIDVYSYTPSIFKYTYERVIEDENGDRQSYNIQSSNRWILGYSGFDLHEFRDQVIQRKAIQGNKLEDFILHYLLIHQVMESNSPIKLLLQDLSIDVETLRLEGFGEIPFVMLTAQMDSFLPDDDIIVEVCGVSGTNQFEELLDIHSVDGQPSCLKKLIQASI